MIKLHKRASLIQAIGIFCLWYCSPTISVKSSGLYF